MLRATVTQRGALRRKVGALVQKHGRSRQHNDKASYNKRDEGPWLVLQRHSIKCKQNDVSSSSSEELKQSSLADAGQSFWDISVIKDILSKELAHYVSIRRQEGIAAATHAPVGAMGIFVSHLRSSCLPLLPCLRNRPLRDE